MTRTEKEFPRLQVTGVGEYLCGCELPSCASECVKTEKRNSQGERSGMKRKGKENTVKEKGGNAR